MLSIFVLFILDLCVADQIFICCNHTCLVRGCQDKAAAPRPCLPLPSAVCASQLGGLCQLQGSPGLEQSHGTVLHVALCLQTSLPGRPAPGVRNVSPAADTHCWGRWDCSAGSMWSWCPESQRSTRRQNSKKCPLCKTSIQILLSKRLLVLLFWLFNIQVDHAQSFPLLSPAKNT